jgi:hypothetical protein
MCLGGDRILADEGEEGLGVLRKLGGQLLVFVEGNVSQLDQRARTFEEALPL